MINLGIIIVMEDDIVNGNSFYILIDFVEQIMCHCAAPPTHRSIENVGGLSK
jgi:hypothetical protein